MVRSFEAGCVLTLRVLPPERNWRGGRRGFAEGAETEQARELNVPKYSISLVMLRFSVPLGYEAVLALLGLGEQRGILHRLTESKQDRIEL